MFFLKHFGAENFKSEAIKVIKHSFLQSFFYFGFLSHSRGEKISLTDFIDL